METSPSPTPHRDAPDSPEFAFWNLGGNPSPPTTLHSADELFSGGFLLPLHLIPPPTSKPEPKPEPNPDPEPEPSAVTSSILTASKRWREMIFRRVEKTREHDHKNNREKKCSARNNKSAELNINIWPFSRSRSAGNNTVRSRPAGSTGRKVSSAPCSRSNSSGSRRSVPNSPGRTGVHLGRTSPVWKIRRHRTGSGPGSDEGKPVGDRPGSDEGKPVGNKGRVLNINVPMCIGYRQQLSCRVDDNAAAISGGGGAGAGGGDSGGGTLFSLRGLFSKKGVLTA